MSCQQQETQPMHMDPCNSSSRTSRDVQQQYSRQSRQRQCGDFQQLTQQQAGRPIPCDMPARPRSSQSRPGSVLQQSFRQPTSCIAGGCPSRGDSRGPCRPGALPAAPLTASRPPSYVAAHGSPSTTPRDHRADVQEAYRGPRSYALALASAGAHRSSGHAAVDRGQHQTKHCYCCRLKAGHCRTVCWESLPAEQRQQKWQGRWQQGPS
jgi:hypothetical protein